MSLGTEGAVAVNTNLTTTYVNLTTTSTNTLVVVSVLCNGGPIVSVTSPSLTFTLRAVSAVSGTPIEMWTAPSTGVLTAEKIDVTQTSAAYMTMAACGVTGVDINNALDDTPVTGTSGALSLSTIAADTIIFGQFRADVTPTADTGNGFSLLIGQQYLLVETQIVSTTQSSLTVQPGGGASNNGGIACAFAALSVGGFTASLSPATLAVTSGQTLPYFQSWMSELSSGTLAATVGKTLVHYSAYVALLGLKALGPLAGQGILHTGDQPRTWFTLLVRGLTRALKRPLTVETVDD